MAHARQQIREQLVTTLTGLTSTASRVYDTRIYNHAQLPSLTIYADRDTVDFEQSTRTHQWHDLQLRVEARAKAKDGVEDAIDTICAEIETAIYADTTLNAKVVDVRLEETSIEYSVEQDQPIAMATLTLMAVYRIAPGAPSTLAN
tara:strand:+ start:585 stop:1022 length:438 start_codon:yes stop_codon:yes gene_type:complete